MERLARRRLRHLPSGDLPQLLVDPAQEGVVRAGLAAADDFKREGEGSNRDAKNEIEAKAPPPLKVTGWVNSDNKPIKLGDLRGKVVVLDFRGVWCGPCREVDREMRSILEVAPDVALRKINVVDWQSPVAGRHLKRVSALPYVVVYGVDGRKIAAIGGLDLKKLRRAIEKGRGL